MLKASRRLLACALTIGALYALAGPAGTPIAAPDARAAIVGDCTPLANWGTPRQDLVQAVLNLVNQNRAASGLGPLKLSPTLTNAALWKSRHMAYFQYMQHDDPAPPVARTWYDRVLTCGYSPNSGAGENIAYGYQTPDAVMSAWMNSAGHRANILNGSYRAIGVGVAASASGLLYWTQDFGTVDDSGSTTPPPSTPPPPTTRSATTPATFTSIFTGTAVSGSAASLAAADGNTYQVSSSGGTTSWYGRMDGVPKSVKTLTVTYTGSNTATCNQTVYAYNWTATAWSIVDSRSVGSTGAVITASLSGTLGNFVSGSTSGSVAIAIVCSGAATPFTARADLLQASYTY